MLLMTHRDDTSTDRLAHASESRLFVSWQDPESREIRPVGVLSSREFVVGAVHYDFRYLNDARRPPFRPFLQFPEPDLAYVSDSLFAMFENRLMPPRRPEYPDYLDSLGLPMDAAPFEVLAASFGIRATDNVEVFREPLLDPDSGLAHCRFLARGVQYIDGAEGAIGELGLDERLVLVPEPTNPKDDRALRLETCDGRPVGFVPAYMLNFLHRAARFSSGFQGIEVSVDGHAPIGSFHLRLLCRMHVPMPPEGFVDESLEPILGWELSPGDPGESVN